MKRFKLVTQDYKTRVGEPNETTWEIGKRVKAAGPPGGGLCTDSFVYCYDSPELAAFLNPIHASINNPRMLVVKTHGRGKNDCGLKRGYRSMTPIKEILCPQPTITQRIAFGILCAKQAYTEQRWNAWADAWLSGEDRSCAAACAAARAAARDAVYYTAYTTAYSAARNATHDAYGIYDSYGATYDACAARDAARAIFTLSGTIDLVAIAKEAMTY